MKRKLLSGKLASLYILLLMCVLVMMALLHRCSPDGSLPRRSDAPSGGDTIDAAVIYGPMSYCMEGDSLGGLNYEMLLALQKGLGRPVRMHPVVSVEDALARLRKGQYDLLASLPADNNLKAEWLTTNPVYLDRMVLIQNADHKGDVPARSVLDLEGDTVHVEKGGSAALRMRNVAKETGADIGIAEEAGMSEEYLALKVVTGEWKYAVVNDRTARRMGAENPTLHYDTPVSFTQFQVWVLRPDDSTFKADVDAWLTHFETTDSARTLRKKYSL